MTALAAPQTLPAVVRIGQGTARPSPRDTEALDIIAALLSGEWRDPAGKLEQIAEVIARSGRPHPGRRPGAALPAGESPVAPFATTPAEPDMTPGAGAPGTNLSPFQQRRSLQVALILVRLAVPGAVAVHLTRADRFRGYGFAVSDVVLQDGARLSRIDPQLLEADLADDLWAHLGDLDWNAVVGEDSHGRAVHALPAIEPTPAAGL